MGTEVKYFHSLMTGAPALSGTAGALIAVLDAVLLNGFGLGTADSLVIAAGIATVTRAAGHSQEVGTVALIAGITGTYSALNGEQRVLSANSTSFTFDATGHADGTAAGTITQKLAPASPYWAKVYSGTNLAVYRSTDPLGTQRYLRVDDTGTFDARCVGYEAMTDVNAGTGPFPTTVQFSGGVYWTKSNAASTATRNWIVVADSRAFHVPIAFHSSGVFTHDCSNFFGDEVPLLAGDSFACRLQGSSSGGNGASVPARSSDISSSLSIAATAYGYSPRSYTGLGSAVVMGQCAKPAGRHSTSSTIASGSATWQVPYPNPQNGGLYVSPLVSVEVDDDSIRGSVPGVYAVPQNLSTLSINTRDDLTGVSGYSGKNFKVVKNGTTTLCLFDVSGPWR